MSNLLRTTVAIISAVSGNVNAWYDEYGLTAHLMPETPISSPAPAAPIAPPAAKQTVKFGRLKLAGLVAALILVALLVAAYVIIGQTKPTMLPIFPVSWQAAYCDKFSGIYGISQRDECAKAGCTEGELGGGYTYGPSGQIQDMGEFSFKCVPR